MSTPTSADPEISPQELARRRDDEDLFLLDVRRADEYEDWAVEGSHNLPIYDQLLDKDFSGLEAHLDEIPKDREVVVICVAGVTSGYAAEFLRDRGYDAKSVSDGMQGWGRVHEPYDVEGVDGVIQVVRPGTGCVSHVVHDDGEAVLVDPSQYVGSYRELADERDLEIVGAVDTHAHADHISGGHAFLDAGLPYYLHDDDGRSLSGYTAIEDGESIEVGSRELDVIHTPGHTPGSVSLRWDGALLSGDTLFLRSVGRPDLEDESEDATREAAHDLFESLDRIRELPADTVVLPGHFSDEDVRPLATTLGDLDEENRLFGMDDADEFVDAIVDSLSDTPANYQQIKKINWGEEPLTDENRDLELGPNNCAAN